MNIIAIDTGEKRIGISIANTISRLPRPLITLANNKQFIPVLKSIIQEEEAELAVIGLPKSLNGNETAQTKWVRSFAKSLEKQLDIPIVLHDETLSSHYADEELKKRGKPYVKLDVDALAATYILNDYLKVN